MARRTACVLAVLMLLGVGAPTAAAATPPNGVLTSADGYVQWAGMFKDVVAPTTPGGPICAGGQMFGDFASCDIFWINVYLPPRTWLRPGGLQFSINWTDDAQDLDLYIHSPEGATVGQSAGVGSTGESVRISRPANGVYRVDVAARRVRGRMYYRGLAEVEYAPSARPLRDLLPNLRTVAPRNIHSVMPAGLNGCSIDEFVKQNARRCLRFDQVVANDGEGPLELRYPLEATANSKRSVQRVYRSDGAYRDLPAATYEIDPIDARFRYTGFAVSRLYRAGRNGEKGELVRSGPKGAACMLDAENHHFGAGVKGEAPRTYTFPMCTVPDGVGAASTTSGISSGWADVQRWDLPNQMIEISGVRPGLYVLETAADPADTVVESEDDDNAASVLVRLMADGSAKIVGN